ncbi:hypothetical protein CPB97_010578 [Podila verticillata]|nr:hypothetical protein CPB97_010578 [Podila verticillata]
MDVTPSALAKTPGQYKVQEICQYIKRAIKAADQYSAMPTGHRLWDGDVVSAGIDPGACKTATITIVNSKDD